MARLQISRNSRVNSKNCGRYYSVSLSTNGRNNNSAPLDRFFLLFQESFWTYQTRANSAHLVVNQRHQLDAVPEIGMNLSLDGR
jgi:hypothetical protein